MITELMAEYDSANSFYRKAMVERTENLSVLTSYETEVAQYNHVTKEIKVYGWYSMTTARHINEFLQQLGFNKMTKKEMDGE